MPVLPTISLGGSAAVKLVFSNTGSKSKKDFRLKGVEAAIASGDIDDAKANATETTVGIDLTGKGNVAEQALNVLKSLQINKRFAIQFVSRKLRNTLGRAANVDALMDANYGNMGIDIAASLLVGLDFSKLGLNSESMNPYLNFLIGPVHDAKNMVFSILDAIEQLFVPGPISEDAERFLQAILKPAVLSTFLVHIEVGVGGAIGAKAKAGVKVELDAHLGAALTFDKDLKEELKAYLVDPKTRMNNRDFFQGNEDRLEELVANGK